MSLIWTHCNVCKLLTEPTSTPISMSTWLLKLPKLCQLLAISLVLLPITLKLLTVTQLHHIGMALLASCAPNHSSYSNSVQKHAWSAIPRTNTMPKNEPVFPDPLSTYLAMKTTWWQPQTDQSTITTIMSPKQSRTIPMQSSSTVTAPTNTPIINHALLATVENTSMCKHSNARFVPTITILYPSYVRNQSTHSLIWMPPILSTSPIPPNRTKPSSMHSSKIMNPRSATSVHHIGMELNVSPVLSLIYSSIMFLSNVSGVLTTVTWIIVNVF